MNIHIPTKMKALGLAMTLAVSACGDSTTETPLAEVDVDGLRSTLASGAVETTAQPQTEATVTTSETTELDDTAPPVVVAETIDDRFVSRQVEYIGTSFVLGSIITTEMDPADYLSGDPDPDIGDASLIIEVTMTRNVDSNETFAKSDFQLVDPSGQRTAAAGVFTPNGQTQTRFNPDFKATVEGIVVFPAIDLDGTSLVIGAAGFVQEAIPFIEADASPIEPNVIDLDAGQFNPNTTFLNWDESCTNTIDTTVVSARIQADGADNRIYVRSADGRRFVAVEVQFDNTGNEGCDGDPEAVYRLDPRLAADGVGSAPTNRIDGTTVDVGTSATTTFWFDISATATELTFTNLEGDVLAAWTVEIPPAFGE